MTVCRRIFIGMGLAWVLFVPRFATALEPPQTDTGTKGGLTRLLVAEGVNDSPVTTDQSWALRGLLRHGFARTPSEKKRVRLNLAEPWVTLRDERWLGRMESRAAELAVGGNRQMPEGGVTYDIPLASHPLVDVYIDHFTGRGRWFFKRWLARADRYVPMMQPILQAKGLPDDTVYLAMVESGFVAHAYSWARAAGFWQFIPSTGRMYKLRQNTWVDERRDFIMATQSAADYLKTLYGEFGDWHLAWAAYNAGAGRVRRALKRYDARDYWGLVNQPRSLAKETRHYVPKIIAAAIVAKNRKHYGFKEVESLPPLTYDEIQVQGSVELRRVARQANTSVPALRELNPALLYDLTPPGRRYRLRVPKGQGNAVARWLKELPKSKRLSYSQYRVRSGDTLTGIAERFGSSITAIREFNSIRNPRLLRPGQRLIVPRLAAKRTAAKRKARVATRASSPKGPAKTHRVAAGDTLWSIAQRYRVSVTDLKRWNRRRGTKIVVGEALRVY